MGFHTHVIAPYTVMKTPQRHLIVLTVCFDLCKYKKSETDPTLYRLYYSELLDSFTDHTHIFTNGTNDGIKQLRLLSSHLLSSQNVNRTSLQFIQLNLK